MAKCLSKGKQLYLTKKPNQNINRSMKTSLIANVVSLFYDTCLDH